MEQPGQHQVRPLIPRILRALTAVLALIAISSASALADPPSDPGAEPVPGQTADSPPEPPPDLTVLSLAELGSPPSIQFDMGPDIASASLSIPVPRGLTPVDLRGKIEFPVKIRYGNITIRQGNRTISRIGLPPEDQADVVLPLTGVQVVSNMANLTIALTAIPAEDFCWTPTGVSLINASVVFTGAEKPPTTVAEFLPPVLRRVTIAIPPTPSKFESEAAIQLATAVAGNSSVPTELAVIPLQDGNIPPPVPFKPLERQIVVKETADRGVSLQGGPGSGSLLITGPGEELTNQARLFNYEWSGYAFSSMVEAERLPGERESLEDTTTLGDINTTVLSAEGLQPEVVLYIDQTRFGQPVGGIRVHLLGSHTPVPDGIGAEVVASIDGQAVDRWSANEGGAIDRNLVIPNQWVKRVTNLAITVVTSASAGRCDDHARTTLRLDPETSIQIDPSKPYVPQGFQSFPQALGQHVHIGIGSDALGDTARAAQIASSLRRISRVPVTTEVSSLTDALSSRDSALLVSGNEAADPQIPLPLTETGGQITVVGLDTKGQPLSLNLDPNTPFASLQTATIGDRSFLVATSNGAPGRLDEMLRWLASQPGRWAGLDGRALISVPDHDPLVVPNPPGEFATKPSVGPLSGNWTTWALASLAVAATAAALMFLRRRGFRRH